MIKKSMAIILSVVIIVSSFAVVSISAASQKDYYSPTGVVDEAFPDYTYQVLNNGNVVITNYTGTDHNIKIPAELGGHPVTRIARGFAYKSLTSVTIPDTVSTIDSFAFGGNNIVSIKIPKSVTSIGNYSFSDCNLLKKITVDKENSVYDSREDCNSIIETDTNSLIQGCSSSVIPNTVTSIAKGAFSSFESLETITIPNSVVTIGEQGFYGTGLKNLYIPDSVTNIGGGAFGECKSLLSVSISDSVSVISSDTFNGCKQLRDVKIGSSVETLGSHAFAWCVNLDRISIPNSVKYIDSVAFWSCTGLSEIMIPDSVTTIGSEAFAGCNKLVSVTIPPSVINIGDKAFGYYLDWEPTTEGFTICGYANTEAERYAKDNGFSFVNLGEIPNQSDEIPDYKNGYYFSTSAGSTTLAAGDAVSCAFSKTKGNLDGDSFSNGNSCPVLRWVSGDESVVKVTDSHAEYSRAELKAEGIGTAKISFYTGSKKISEAEIRVGMSAKALKDNADLRMIQNALKSGQDILSDYSGMDRSKIAVTDTTLNYFSDIYGSIVKNIQQEFGIVGDDLDLAEDEVIKEVLKEYFEYKTPVTDKEKKISKAWNIIKTGMNDAKQLYNAKKNKAAEKAAKSTIKAATKLSDTKIDKIFKAFKGVSTIASEGFTLYEISATAIMLNEFEKDTVLELMNSFPKNSSAYQALGRLYADMTLSPDEYIIKTYASEKMVDLVKKCFEAILVQGEAPIKIVEAVASTLSLIYDNMGGITVKQIDEAAVATTIATEAYSLFPKNNDSSKRKMLFCFLKSAISVELDKCISVCKTGSADLKYNAEYYQRKIKALSYDKYIADCVKEYNDPESVAFENPDLERYGISARIKIDTRNNLAPTGISADGDKVLIIPSSTGEYTVTTIAENGFENTTGYQTIYLPDSVTKIGSSAFYNCSDFKTVYSGFGINEIGEKAFMGCTSLETVTSMPELQSIGVSSFENCSSLVSFMIGEKTNILGDCCFSRRIRKAFE